MSQKHAKKLRKQLRHEARGDIGQYYYSQNNALSRALLRELNKQDNIVISGIALVCATFAAIICCVVL